MQSKDESDKSPDIILENVPLTSRCGNVHFSRGGRRESSNKEDIFNEGISVQTGVNERSSLILNSEIKSVEEKCLSRVQRLLLP